MILLVGNLDRDEFQAIRPALEAHTRCLVAETPAQALAALETARRPQLPPQAEPQWIVLAQAYPGQFGPEEVDRLRCLAPLAPVVVVEGPWSAGPWRSGRPLVGVHRVAWLDFPRKAPDQWHRFCRGEAAGTEWMLPPTASDEERTLAAAQAPGQRRHGQVVIWTARFDCYQWISTVCRHGGYATVWCRPGQHVRLDGPWAAIFDADGFSSLESPWEELRRLAASVHGGPVVVLLGEPRPEQCRVAHAHGATAVLNKPLAIEALWAALRL